MNHRIKSDAGLLGVLLAALLGLMFWAALAGN